MGIWIPQARTKSRNKGAFRGRLTCPVCDSEAVRYMETIGMFRIRYRCRKCGLTFQYDTSNADPGMAPGSTHPYALFKKNKFTKIIDYAKAADRENQNRR